jgi:hypothetical protein
MWLCGRHGGGALSRRGGAEVSGIGFLEGNSNLGDAVRLGS